MKDFYSLDCIIYKKRVKLSNSLYSIVETQFKSPDLYIWEATELHPVIDDLESKFRSLQNYIIMNNLEQRERKNYNRIVEMVCDMDKAMNYNSTSLLHRKFYSSLISFIDNIFYEIETYRLPL